jgi:hypothetical protein
MKSAAINCAGDPPSELWPVNAIAMINRPCVVARRDQLLALRREGKAIDDRDVPAGVEHEQRQNPAPALLGASAGLKYQSQYEGPGCYCSLTAARSMRRQVIRLVA